MEKIEFISILSKEMDKVGVKLSAQNAGVLAHFIPFPLDDRELITYVSAFITSLSKTIHVLNNNIYERNQKAKKKDSENILDKWKMEMKDLIT